MKNPKVILTCFCAGIALSASIVLTALADPPVLTITALQSNQFSIAITNGVTNETYVLYWTPTLSDPDNYPFTLLSVGNLGQTNWTVDGTDWPISFFRVNTGTDWDSDGVPNWQDADAADATIGILRVTIDSPLNGSNLQ
jgi:hypothetical protein